MKNRFLTFIPMDYTSVMKTLDTLHAYRNTCTVSYWRDGWHRVAAKVGKPITITEVNNDIQLPFGQVHALGSGHGHRVRMGDEMRPTDYAVECKDEDADALKAAHDAYIGELNCRF